MTEKASRNDADALRYVQKTMTWYGFRSPVGLGLFILAAGGFVVLLHVAAVIP